MKAKAWLHSQGHIATAGRGRPPKFTKDGREVTAVLLEATKSGVTFSDWPKGKVEVKECSETKTAKVTVTKDTSETGFVEPVPYRYDERKFKAVESGGRERSMREACWNCHVSLVVCYCESPRILALPPRTGSVVVSIVPKTED